MIRTVWPLDVHETGYIQAFSPTLLSLLPLTMIMCTWRQDSGALEVLFDVSELLSGLAAGSVL